MTGSLIIVFSALITTQRHNHHFSEKLLHKNDVFDENYGVLGSNSEQLPGEYKEGMIHILVYI